MYTIQLTTTEKIKNNNTYLNKNIQIETITDEVYNSITNDKTIKYFRRMGGRETLKWGYTCAGYKVIKLISTSPNKQYKTIKEFKFKYIE